MAALSIALFADLPFLQSPLRHLRVRVDARALSRLRGSGCSLAEAATSRTTAASSSEAAAWLNEGRTKSPWSGARRAFALPGLPGSLAPLARSLGVALCDTLPQEAGRREYWSRESWRRGGPRITRW
jgi:hypothetical protein